jgi:hypothetical protein
MTDDDPFIIRMNIARYEAMLGLSMDDERRSVVEVLLVEARRDLVLIARAARPAPERERPLTAWPLN